MKTIASRALAASPGKVWADLDREGALVITKDGVPRSIMVPTSDATLLEDVQELVFARARKAVRAIRARAADTDSGSLTRADIGTGNHGRTSFDQSDELGVGDAPVWVFDTNVLVSGLLSPAAPPGRLLDVLLARRLRLAVDDRVELEYREVLARPRLGIESGPARGLPGDPAVPGARHRPPLGPSRSAGRGRCDVLGSCHANRCAHGGHRQPPTLFTRVPRPGHRVVAADGVGAVRSVASRDSRRSSLPVRRALLLCKCVELPLQRLDALLLLLDDSS